MEGKSIGDELNRFRTKLLDDSNRNPLINFKKPRASTLQIVDELPDEIFSRLVSVGKKFRFAATLQDDLSALTPAIAANGAQSLSNLTVELQPQTSPELPDAPHAGSEVESRHTDDRLQTDRTEDSLEAILRSMDRRARTAIEETGVNYLFLVLGLLAWKKSTDGREHLAPLILIPVEIDKYFDGRSSRYEYSIRWREEEIQGNLCLAKRLEQEFGLRLPAYENDVTPEQYFETVQREVCADKGWSVRREAFMGFFSFQKLLMYVDIDPENWTNTGALLPGSVTSQVIWGRDIDTSDGLYADDYEVDTKPNASDLIISLDADSSQHSALLDISAGKNLVIEGPPGTGKSQTIANAIAMAICEGKTVLFVAEKLAALEVVQHKLDMLGLNDFCLELHSDGASPRHVFKSFKQRLESRYAHPQRLESLKEELEHKKKLISDYLAAARQPTGPNQEPFYKVVWRVIDEKALGRHSLRTAKFDVGITASQFNEGFQLLEAYSETLSEIERPKKSPWWGFWPHHLNPNDCQPLREILRGMKVVCGNIAEVSHELTSFLDHRAIEWSLKRLESAEILSELEELAHLSAQFQQPVKLRTFIGEAARIRATAFIGEVDELKELEQQLANWLLAPLDVGATNANAIADLVTTELLPRFPKATWRDVKQLRSRATAVLTVLSATEEIVQQMQQQGLGQVRNFAELEQAEFLAKLLRHPIVANRADIPQSLFLKSTHAAILKGMADCESIRARRIHLEEVFHLEAIPSQEEVIEIAKQLRVYSDSWFPSLFPSFRTVKRALWQFRKPTIGKRVSEWLEHLQQLSKWQSDYRKFQTSEELSRSLGELFNGVETDWEQVKTLFQWAVTAGSRGCDHSKCCALLAKRDTAALTSQSIASVKKLLQAEFNSQTTHAIGFNQSTNLSQIPFADAHRRATLLRTALQELETLAEVFTLPDEMQLAAIVNLCASAKRAFQLRSHINDRNQWEVLEDWYSPESRDLTELNAAVTWAARYVRLEIPVPIEDKLFAADLHVSLTKLRDAVLQFRCQKDAWHNHRASLEEFGELSPTWLNWDISNDIATTLGNRLESLLQRVETLPSWAAFCRTKAHCDSLGLESFTSAAVDDQIEVSEIASCYRLTLLERVVESHIWGTSVLKTFSRQTMEKARSRFQELDRELLKLNRILIAYKASQRRTPAGVTQGRVAELTEMGLIRNEIQKQQRYCRIRDFLKRAGAAAQALKPCFMMSPLSVAQYLDPTGVQFDLVIMDEASQIKPEDALGTLLRAKQIVVVGDPKQLPPTSFFDAMDDDVADDDATKFDNVESMLEVAMRAFQPVRRLRWHYRSKHESLIQFSNDRFYDRDLVVFPSATGAAENLGLRHHTVENAFFEGGANIREAEVVARAIVEHAKRCPEESLGVGTFNAKQSELIQDFIIRLCESGPDAREAREAIDRLNSHSEKLFVKNLENLQGDERDVIFISYTYGPDRDTGRVFNRFGPVNGKTGWRRINVLVSRARRRLEVFSSLNPSDIQGGPDKSDGVNAFRDFLEFAQKGVLVDRGSATGRAPDSAFEEAVARVVTKMGLEVVPQVGVAGYFIDIGVRRRGESDFLLGIECDGATYHSSKSARDRDRLREEVIVSRGWKLHRIWSTDWYLNQLHEEERLRRTLENVARINTGENNAEPCEVDDCPKMSAKN